MKERIEPTINDEPEEPKKEHTGAVIRFIKNYPKTSWAILFLLDLVVPGQRERTVYVREMPKKK